MAHVKKAKGYSLWLMPPGGLRRKLAKTICRLAEECKGPVFEPHVTLVGGIEKSEKEMVRKTAELAGKIRQFKITLGRTEGTGHYFRCLFAGAYETSELMVANDKAREAFGKKNGPRYKPHLSLFYGKLPSGTKKEIACKYDFSGAKFEVKRIRLMLTKGPPSNWKKVREFYLK